MSHRTVLQSLFYGVDNFNLLTIVVVKFKVGLIKESMVTRENI